MNRYFALVAVSASLAAPSALSAQTWSATHTQALTNLVQAVDLGPASPTQQLTVRVALAVQNQAGLLQTLTAQNTPGNAAYGKFLTPAQFAATYGPSATQVAAVTTYLKSAGLTNIAVEPNNLLVSATGSVAQVNAAFNTAIENFQQNGRLVYGNIAAAQVPASLGGTVVAVLGLNNIGLFQSALRTRAQSAPAVGLPQYAVSYNPQNFWTAYDANSVPAAANASIAIIAEGELSGVLSDLRIEEAAAGLPQVPVTIVQVGLQSGDTSGADEFDLDSQFSAGMAGGALKMLYMYDGPDLTDASLTLEISRWATDGLARAASASLGECEIFPYLDGTTIAVDDVLMEGAVQGQSFFASSGDTGSFCPAGPAGANGVPAGAPLVQYPAASEWATGVGGTTLLTNSDGTYDTEITWYAGGGGISQFEGPGFWQKSAGIAAATELGSRAVPDIAYDADPYSGANVYVNGAAEGVGGTSLSSPLALGTWARMISADPSLGYAPLQFYSLYAPSSPAGGTYPVGGFHDITVGSNGLYTALPGYDYTTGLGTPDVAQMYHALTGVQ